MLVALLAAGTVLVPVAGDQFRYSVSTGEHVTLEVLRVEPRAEQLVATVRERRVWPDGTSEEAQFDLVRTAQALALDMPPAADNARLSPLVYFFASASVRDSWLAQQGVFLDPTGNQVRYQIQARVDAIETITGPAGTFPGCRRVSYTSTLDSGRSPDRVTRLTLWLHPDIGIVRSYSVTGTSARLTELVGYRKF
ncbi:MAG: hypothetical protein FJZ01_00310 [Candidatus Sericytochromatia bacterium]|nr:hypothetical protein [Candidatus Tanganyikabacteria bacterium]